MKDLMCSIITAEHIQPIDFSILTQDDAIATCHDIRAVASALRESLKKNRELHRRCQLAESAANVSIESCRRQGVSIGRVMLSCRNSILERRYRKAINVIRNFFALRREEDVMMRAGRTLHSLKVEIERLKQENAALKARDVWEGAD